LDESLIKALDFANYRATIETQRKNIKKRYKSMCTFHYNNGMYTVNKELISFVSALLNSDTKSAVVLDEKDIPIDIANLVEFQQQIVEIYNKATNEYLSGYLKLSRARDIKKAMNW